MPPVIIEDGYVAAHNSSSSLSVRCLGNNPSIAIGGEIVRQLAICW